MAGFTVGVWSRAWVWVGGHDLFSLPCCLLSWVQDSDGDKSDDLVVDVSNEVRAGLGCKEDGGLELSFPRVGLCSAA